MQRHKLISLAIAFLVSLVLWAYAVNYVSPESTVEISGIPVRFRAEDILLTRGLIMTAGGGQSVKLKVRGNRHDLKELTADNVRITADLSTIDEVGSKTLSYTVTYPDTVANGDIAVESKSPAVVKVEIGKATTKTLALTVNTQGKPADNFLLDTAGTLTDVESVTVSGPSSEVDAIAKVQVDVDIDGLNASRTEEIPFSFYKEDNTAIVLSELCTITVKRDAESDGTGNTANVTLAVLQYKDISFRPNWQNIPPEYEIDERSCTFEPNTIRVTGQAEDLERLGTSLQVDADLNNVSKKGLVWQVNCPVNLPSGLSVYTPKEEEGSGKNVLLTFRVAAVPEQTVSEASTEPEATDTVE